MTSVNFRKINIRPYKPGKSILKKKAKVIKKGVFVDEAIHNNLYDFDIEKDVIAFNLELWK